MSYVKNNLLPNEKLIYSARIHFAVVGFPMFLSVLMLLLFVLLLPGTGEVDPSTEGMVLLCDVPMIFIALAMLLQAIMILLTTEFAVTNRRVIAKTGFIRRQTLEMMLSKIESVSVKQTISGRLMNFGTVTVTGTGGTSESFKGIRNPLKLRHQIYQVIDSQTQLQQKPAETARLQG